MIPVNIRINILLIFNMKILTVDIRTQLTE